MLKRSGADGLFSFFRLVWHSERVSSIPTAIDVLDPTIEVLPLPDVAERLGVSITRIHQMLRDGQLLAVSRDGRPGVPADFLVDGGVVKGLSGTVNLLSDGGYRAEEILRWLFTEDESLPGTPIAVLRSDRSREIKRRAQAMSF